MSRLDLENHMVQVAANDLSAPFNRREEDRPCCLWCGELLTEDEAETPEEPCAKCREEMLEEQDAVD